MSWLRLTANSRTASRIHIRHIQSVWAHLFAFHGYTVVASNSYTHTTWTWLRFWGSWSLVLVESKWCHYVMVEVEVDIHLKLLPTTNNHITHTQSGLSTLICWVHEHRLAALNRYFHPTWLRFWASVSLVEYKWCHYVMVEADSHLKLLPPSILHIYNMFEHIDMLSMGIW